MTIGGHAAHSPRRDVLTLVGCNATVAPVRILALAGGANKKEEEGYGYSTS